MGILIGDRKTQIVSIEFKGQEPYLYTAANLPLSGKETIPQIQHYTGLNGKRIDAAGIVIPQHQTDIRFLTLPMLPANDLNNMVRFEIVKKLDYGLEDACIDYTISEFISSQEKKLFRLIGFSCSRSVVQPIIKDFEKAGIPIQVVDVVPMALMNFYMYIEPDFENRTLLGINIGDTNANLVVAKQGKLLFTRHFPIDFESSSATASFIQHLSTEIYRTLEYCEIHFEPLQCDQIVLSGKVPASSDLSKTLENEIGFPCKIVSINMLPASPQIFEDLGNENGTNLVVATGLALRMGNEKR